MGSARKSSAPKSSTSKSSTSKSSTKSSGIKSSITKPSTSNVSITKPSSILKQEKKNVAGTHTSSKAISFNEDSDSDDGLNVPSEFLGCRDPNAGLVKLQLSADLYKVDPKNRKPS